MQSVVFEGRIGRLFLADGFRTSLFLSLRSPDRCESTLSLPTDSNTFSFSFFGEVFDPRITHHWYRPCIF